MNMGYVADDTIDEILSRSDDLSHAPHAVGIAILPFRLVGVITDLKGTKLGVGGRALPRMDVDHVAQGVTALAKYLVSTSLGIDLPNPRIRIGLQIGGPVDTATGVVRYYHNPLDTVTHEREKEDPWVDVPLADLVQEETGCPTVVDNDAHALAAYELKLGRYAASFALIYINDGVGACVVLDGKLLPAPMEFGHLRVWEHGRPCQCENVGCIDAYAGRRAIRAMVSDLTQLDGIDTIERAADIADGHPEKATAALEAFAIGGQSIARGAAAMLTLFGPSHLVIYGPDVLVDSRRGSAATDRFLTEVRKYSTYAYPATRDCELVLRPFPPNPDSDRGAHGAALIALHRHFYAPLGSNLEHSI
jgi:predicted NBD/HSP70 family sugar kinase